MACSELTASLQNVFGNANNMLLIKSIRKVYNYHVFGVINVHARIYLIQVPKCGLAAAAINTAYSWGLCLKMSLLKGQWSSLQIFSARASYVELQSIRRLTPIKKGEWSINYRHEEHCTLNQSNSRFLCNL